MLRRISLTVALCLAPLAGATQDLGLAAPRPVVESGLLKHILPRFSLKTGIRAIAQPDGAMTLAAQAPGTPVFQGADAVWHLRIDDQDNRQVRFRDWLTGEIGRRTIDSFQPDGTQPFTASIKVEAAIAPLSFDGDAEQGARASLEHCGRCHVIGPQNAMSGIGSTPSFAALKSLSDWDSRFQAFYVLRPHAAFTVIDGVTADFDPARPSPIAPIVMTLDDLDDMLAYVASMDAADLGAPIQLQ